MSIDQHTPRPTNDHPDQLHTDDQLRVPATAPGAPTSSEERPRRFELSATQVVGGALAAMTAAALGSRLGVAGTIAGAALASIIAAVAGAVYTASLRHTQERVRTVFSTRTPGPGEPTTVRADPTPAGTTTVSRPAAHGPVQSAPTGRPTAQRPADRLAWRGPVLGALAAFVLAAVALTGFEVLSGAALSGGRGTTIEQAARPERPATKPTTGSSETSSSRREKSPSPSATESSTAATPSQPPRSDPTPTTTPQPSAPATPQPSVTAAEPTPSTSVEPSSSAPSAEATSEAPSSNGTPTG